MIAATAMLQSQTAHLVKNYGDRLVDELQQTPDWIQDRQLIGGDELRWNNPENIATGTSGIALFLIELYRQFREDKYLLMAEALIDDMLTHCRTHASSNFSLYTGRGGVVYVIVHYHLVKENKAWLAACVEMLQPANREYLHSRYTSDDLYDGRSGTMLVILYLYQLTQDELLLDYLHQFVVKIQAGAWLSEAGMYWRNDEEYNLKPACGMAHGVAGIRYAFEQLHACTKQASFDLIKYETKRYIDHCWKEDFQNWGNYRKEILTSQTLHALLTSYAANDTGIFEPASEYTWATGATGILLGTYSDAEVRLPGQLRDRLNKIVVEHAISTTGLYNGLAGIGLFYLTVKQDEGSPELQEIMGVLSDSLSDAPQPIDLTGGLFHGSLGVAYFLLKAVHDEESATHILAPGLPQSFASRPVNISVQPELLLNQLLSRYYPRTIVLMEQLAPAVLAAYFQQAGRPGTVNELERFTHFIQQIVPAKIAPASLQRLEDLFALEKEVYAFLQAEQRSWLQIYLDELLYQEKAITDLNKPEAWLMEQCYSMSTKIKIIKSRWNWSFADNYKTVNGEQKENLNTAPATFTYLYKVTADGEVMEMLLGLDTLLLLQHFMQPKYIGQALKDIRSYIFSLPEAALRNLLQVFTKYANTGDFKDQLDDMMRYEVTQWIYNELLTPATAR